MFGSGETRAIRDFRGEADASLRCQGVYSEIRISDFLFTTVLLD